MFRSIIFTITLIVSTVVLGIVFLPLLFTGKKNARIMIKAWGGWCLFLLDTIGRVNQTVEGDVPKKGPLLVIARHQSQFETFSLGLIFPHASFVLKKELLKVPFWGWYLKKVGMIAIDRSTGTTAMRQVLQESIRVWKEGGSVIIFPEGTRVAPDEEGQYNPGVAGLYELACKMNVPVIPVALNSGYHWPARKIKLIPGTVVIKLLKPLEAGLNRREAVRELKRRIDTACKDIVNRYNR